MHHAVSGRSTSEKNYLVVLWEEVTDLLATRTKIEITEHGFFCLTSCTGAQIAIQVSMGILLFALVHLRLFSKVLENLRELCVRHFFERCDGKRLGVATRAEQSRRNNPGKILPLMVITFLKLVRAHSAKVSDSRFDFVLHHQEVEADDPILVLQAAAAVVLGG